MIHNLKFHNWRFRFRIRGHPSPPGAGLIHGGLFPSLVGVRSNPLTTGAGLVHRGDVFGFGLVVGIRRHPLTASASRINSRLMSVWKSSMALDNALDKKGYSGGDGLQGDHTSA